MTSSSSAPMKYVPALLALLGIPWLPTLGVPAVAAAKEPKLKITLDPVIFPPLQEAYAPLIEGEHVALATRVSAPLSFSRGGTLARVTCAPGERIDFALPRGSALLLAGSDGVEPPVSFGDGSGAFASATPRRLVAGYVFEPPHPTQRHALLSCPARKIVYSARILVRQGEDGPKVAGGPMPVAGAREVALRRADACTWMMFHRAEPEAPLSVRVRSGERYLVRARAVFARGALTTGFTRYQVVAGEERVDLASSLGAASGGVTLGDGAVPGTTSELLLAAGLVADRTRAGSGTLQSAEDEVDVPLSCSQACLLRVERVADTEGTDMRLEAARARATLDSGLSLRTLPPRGEGEVLDMRSVVPRVSEPVVVGDGMDPTGGFVGQPPAVEAVRGADAFVRARDGAATLTFDVPSLPVSHLRLTLHAAGKAAEGGDVSMRVDMFDAKGRSRRANVLSNRSLALPAGMRRSVFDAYDSSDALAEGEPSASAEDPARAGAASFAAARVRFESRILVPLDPSLERVSVTPLSPAARSASRPFVSLSVGTRQAVARPVSFVEAADARIAAMRAHFAIPAKDREAEAANALEGIDARGAPAAVKELERIEASIARAGSASDAAPFLERRDASLRGLAAGTLARSLAWDTYFNHPAAGVACESARMLARAGLAQEDTRTSALASFAVWRTCGRPDDLRASRTALLRGGALASAQELEPLLETPPDERVALLAQAAALRGASPKARAALLAHPAFRSSPHLHLPVDDALREAQGFLVNLNKETGVEETRVSSASVAPARWTLERGKTYAVTWRRVFDSTVTQDGWLLVSGPGFEERFPLSSCPTPDSALEGGLCPADSDVFVLPEGVGPVEVALRPSGGRVAVTLRERVAAGGGRGLLSERERAVAEFRRLLARKETAGSAEAARLVERGDVVYRESKFRDALAPLYGRLARGYAWTPVFDNVLHAGLWREDATTSAWPLAAEEAVPYAYSRARSAAAFGPNGPGASARSYRLFPSRRLAFRADRAGTLLLRLQAASDLLLPLEPQRMRVSRQGRIERVAMLGGATRTTEIAVAVAAAGEVVTAELLDDVSGQGVFLSLPKAGPDWALPDERTWYVSTPGQPVRAYVEGPGRVRIEERDPALGEVEIRYLLIAKGWHPITVKPSGGASRSQVRLSQLRAAPEVLVTRPRAEPFAQGSLALLAPASALAGEPAPFPQAAGRGPARLAVGESHSASWRAFSEVETRSTVDDGDTSEGDGRLAGAIGIRRKQAFEDWGIHSGTAASMIGVRDRQVLAMASQKISFAPKPRFFRYSFLAEGVLQRPGGSRGNTEWGTLTRHELSFPLGFGQGIQATPRLTYFYRWQSLDKVAERAKYEPGAINTLIDHPWYRANPYGLGLGTRVVLAPWPSLAGRVVLDVETVSGSDVNPMNPVRLWGEGKWVQLVSNFDLEAFGRVEHLDASRDALLRTSGVRVTTKAGVGGTYTHHARGSRLFEAGVRAGQDFERGSPFGAATFVWHITPDALLRHDAPDELLMREERLRRMGGGEDVAAAGDARPDASRSGSSENGVTPALLQGGSR